MVGTRADDLPDHVVGHIFSFLPTKDIVKTCFLGKSWRYYWTTVPTLKFHVTSCNDSFVDRVVSRYKRQKVKVKKFHLDIHPKGFCADKIDSWVAFAIDRQVEELLLDFQIWYEYCWYGMISRELRHRLSPSLYKCSSLTILSLRGCRFPSCEGISWSSLKSLSIEGVVRDQLQKILMGSPVLEHLTLERSWLPEEIRSMSLRELVIDHSVSKSGLHISTPQLLSLHVGVHYLRELIIRIVEAPSLLEAALDFDSPTESDFCLLEELLCKLQNATRILFGPWCCRVRTVVLLPTGGYTFHITFHSG